MIKTINWKNLRVFLLVLALIALFTSSYFLIEEPTEFKTILKSLSIKLPKQENNILIDTKASSTKFLFFGDLMLDRHVGEKIAGKNISYLLSSLAGENNGFFTGFDIVSANLEGAVTNKGGHYLPTNAYDFAFSPERINELKQYNFNYFALANNHFSDQGQKGIEESRINLSSLGFNYSGSADAEVNEHSKKEIEISGRKITMLAFSMVYNDFDLEAAKKIIGDSKDNSDLVIVNIHWGTEYEHKFNKHQETIGRAFIDSGADAIIGHHPHVIQGMEIYKGKPIFYSLGNFIFDQYFSPDTQEGLALGINFSDDIISLNIYPLKSEKTIPRLMDEKEKEIFFNKFMAWSNLSDNYRTELIQGELKITNN